MTYTIKGHFTNGAEYVDEFCNPVQLEARLKRISKNQACVLDWQVFDDSGNKIGGYGEEPADGCPEWIAKQIRPRQWWDGIDVKSMYD